MGLGEGEALNCLQSCPCPFIHSWAPEPFLGAKMLAGCFLDVLFPPFQPQAGEPVSP